MDEADEKKSERSSLTTGSKSSETRKLSERSSITAAEVDAILTKVMTSSPPKRSSSLQSLKSQDARSEDGRRSTSHVDPKRTSLVIPSDLGTPVARKRSSPRMTAQERVAGFIEEL